MKNNSTSDVKNKKENLNFFKKLKDSNLIIYTCEFLDLEELFKIGNLNKRTNTIIKQKMMMTTILNNMKTMLLLKFTDNFSNLLISKEENYLKFTKQFNPILLNKISSTEKLKIFLIIFCIKYFKLKDGYKDDKIFVRGNKLKIYKDNNYKYIFNDLLPLFISINKIKIINDEGKKIKIDDLRKLDIDEYKDISFLIDWDGDNYFLNNSLKSVGILDAESFAFINFHNFIKTEQIIRLKFKINSENSQLNDEQFDNGILGITNYIKKDFSNLKDIIVVDSSFLEEESNDLIHILNKLYQNEKTYSLIKFKNLKLAVLIDESFDTFNYGFMSGQYIDTETEYIYNLHKYIVNCKKFKIVGGKLNKFSLASDFLNVNESIEKLVLKGQVIREKDFIKFLKNIQLFSNIKIIKTSIKYSYKIIKTLLMVNKKLNKSIELLKC